MRSPRVSGLRGKGLLLAALASVAILVSALIIRTEERNVPLRFPPADYRGFPDVPLTGLLVGTNYTHYAFPHCSWHGTNIIRSFQRNVVREIVHDQLSAMRRGSVTSLRIILWHMTEPGPNDWGPVPSLGGALGAPYRRNLQEYLTEIRRFGFRRLTVSFGPQWTNNPVARRYDPSKFEENWSFLRDVRAIIKQYGPRETRFDLINEGAPSDYLNPKLRRQMSLYISRMYSRYVRAFGNRDVVVSVIGPESVFDHGNRLQNLINIIASTRSGQPHWFEIHLNDTGRDVLHGLEVTDEILSANGLDQRIVIGEAAYNDAPTASAIATFMRSSSRVEEILQWFSRANASCNESPPYSVTAYRQLRMNNATGRGVTAER